MRVLVQRVRKAAVAVNDLTVGEIGLGVLLLLGVEEADQKEDVDWLVRKISRLRIFDDELGVMNHSLLDVAGDALVVSQFTLFASTQKGNRPSYTRAARPDLAVPLFEHFSHQLSLTLNRPVARGVFGADMQVTLLNDGPVTIWLDSKSRE
ncbi:D-aminoacyl-tRNA deacylase [Neisseriaceae bacterium TC5R-5]|nr:D-aminoacyl-tRNA deacylase [Neisseriaceae bacterium TC5R-5]